jgi:hypothetical protein
MTVSDKDFEELKRRVKKLEEAIFDNAQGDRVANKPKKQITLSEIARKNAVKNANGQQKVAIIVGYFEIEKNDGVSKPDKIKKGWKIGKFPGKYHPSFLSRATGDLLRNHEDGSYDLTQAGEDYFKGVTNATEDSAGTKK